MRSKMTDTENRLWHHLRNRRLENLKFRRQVVLGRYIVDFLCCDKKIIIEVDGGQHDEQRLYDEKRIIFLESLGFRVLRFWNDEVLIETDAVLEHILRICAN